jgi:large subunit ribosomal protein L18
MKKTMQKQVSRTRRHARIRAKVIGTATKPRLAVFRSNRAVYAQLIDDGASKTLAAADSRVMTGATLVARGTEVGKAVAEQAKKHGIESVVFDRGGFQYTGVVAAVAEGARAAGLVF